MTAAKWVACIVLFACTSSGAFVLREEQVPSVPRGVTVTDDIALVGSQVSFAGTTTGDLMAAGGSVTIEGGAGNDLEAAGGNVTITGPVGHTLKATGGNVTVGSRVGWNAMLAGGNVTISSNADIGRDLVIGAGNASIAGHVRGGLLGGGGDLVLSGPVDGGVNLQGNRLRLLPGAVIRGNLVFKGPTAPEISPGARVMGKVTHIPQQPRRHRGIGFGGWILRFLLLLITGGALYLLAPRGVLNAAGLVRNWPISLLVGFVGMIAIPIAAIIVMVTVIGLPVGATALVIYIFLLIAGVSIAALALGRWLLQLARVAEPRTIWAWLLGLAILMLVFLVPILGGLARFVALLLGFGAILRVIGSSWQRIRSAPAAPAA